MKTLRVQIKRQWYIIDAKNKILGRLATQISQILRGKLKTQFNPSSDFGDYVVVINAEKIDLTRKKKDNKEYFFHSGFLGGLKTSKFKDRILEKPTEVILKAVWGMLPKNRLSRKQILRLKVYRGESHPHQNHDLKKLS